MKNSKSRKSKASSKHLKDYLNFLRLFIIILFVLSIIQIIFILLGYFPKIEFVNLSDNAAILKTDYLNIITLIGILEILVVILAGFYSTLKSTFKLRDIFFSAVLLFLSAILAMFFIPSFFQGMPLIFKVINGLVLLLSNFVLFLIAYLAGGILAVLYKKINQKII